MVLIQTETVRKRCKYGVRLEQAESVLCPCVQAIFSVQTLRLTIYKSKCDQGHIHLSYKVLIKVVHEIANQPVT